MGHEAAGQPVWVAWIPILVFAGIMLLRMKGMSKARPLRLPMLWILPILILVVIGFALSAVPPHGLGWGVLVLGLAVGAGLGLWRARLMHLHIEGEGTKARVMMRQSPAALLLVLALFAARRVIFSQMPMEAGDASHATVLASMLTDFFLGMAPGLVCGQRLTLWLRARDMITHHQHDS